MQRAKLLNVGFGNFVVSTRVVAIVSPSSSPMRRLREDARQEGRLIDATQGRKTRSIIITDSNHLILSAIQAETVGQRFMLMEDAQAAKRPEQAAAMAQALLEDDPEYADDEADDA
ncbi:hypothetical protein DGI_3216 [Megalodesulfovibrio gigas DSM 1382 = ATCC 19364]|uniref:Putative regulatory protein DGI_3216 n=1 Tax=Megalodesulfovibrio gigas (strain ATCC 19364 / DSM 1382 / NCIMB 9332 / VKM B-1759) TaxID=1121448 RepID=T2GE93_MEGG1|nr:hypothetical protein DGI_3216 [Megalodesulfovibrio gigas DSM 1382 = ATCC 19364]